MWQCNEEEEEEEFEGWDEELDLGALEAYLDSMCGQVLNPDAWMYCGLLESITDCINGDTLACLEVEGWLDTVEWTWQDDEEDDEVDEEEFADVPDEEDGDIDDASEEEEEGAGTLLLTITELGYGKRTPFEEYRPQNRNGMGLLSYRVTGKTGKVVGAVEVHRDDQLMMVTDTGRVIRIAAHSVRRVGRVSQGVRLMRLDGDEKIVDVARLEDAEEEEEEEVEVNEALEDVPEAGASEGEE